MHQCQKLYRRSRKTYTEVMGKPTKPAKTLGYPGKCLRKSTEVEEEVKTTQYWSIIRKLMYYMMKVGPELANPVRELSRQMVKPNKEHWKAVE